MQPTGHEKSGEGSGNGYKLHEERLHFDIRLTFFTVGTLWVCGGVLTTGGDGCDPTGRAVILKMGRLKKQKAEISPTCRKR